MRHSFSLSRVLATLCVCSASLSAAPLPLEELVDPLIGSAGRGSCMPGPCLPHASIYPSPETLTATPGGYMGDQPIVGFAQLHTQGAGGNPSYGNFLITPRLGLAIKEAEHASPKAEETAKAYGYSVRLTKDNIRAEIAPARHSALYRFTFPASSEAHINLDVARKIRGEIALDEGSVRIDPKTGIITGGGRFSKNWNPAPYDLFFAARLDTTPDSVGTWTGTAVTAGASATARRPADAGKPGESLGVFARFQTKAGQQVMLKIAVSFTSVEQAQRWLDAEIPAWDFAGLQTAAAATWRLALNAATLEGAGVEESRKFTTAVWHAMVQPRDRTGDLPGFDPKVPLWDDHYTMWDTWKSLFPLMSILEPEAMRDNIRSFIERHRVARDGFVAAAFIQGREFKVGQGGNEVDNVIADAYAKKIHGVDWEQAYAVLRNQAERGRTANYREKGWMASDEKTDYSHRIRSGSATLDFAYNDFSVAQVAKGLGHQADYERYLARSRNWLNVWDDTLASDGYRGFVRGRARDGKFSSTPAGLGFNTDFYEAICWEFSFNVPHDVPTLVEKMGGRATFIRRLAHAFREGYINFGNEPAFMSPWLFARVGRPYLAAYWADQLRGEFAGRNLPGDDDDGAMSSLYVFLTSGFFPVAGQDLYLLHGPRVPRVVFRQSNGRTFTVVGENAGGANLFVQRATLNGRPLDEPSIRHADIVAGGELRFVMGPQPSAWVPAEISTRPPPRPR
jgi:predicted alpha-1,2-mannosidase